MLLVLSSLYFVRRDIFKLLADTPVRYREQYQAAEDTIKILSATKDHLQIVRSHVPSSNLHITSHFHNNNIYSYKSTDTRIQQFLKSALIPNTLYPNHTMKTTSWLIAALAAGVVAIPASNETGHISIIERRGHYGWVSSYAPTDPGCKAKWGGERPKIIGERCIPFSPITDNIGVWWGSVSLDCSLS